MHFPQNAQSRTKIQYKWYNCNRKKYNSDHSPMYNSKKLKNTILAIRYASSIYFYVWCLGYYYYYYYCYVHVCVFLCVYVRAPVDCCKRLRSCCAIWCQDVKICRTALDRCFLLPTRWIPHGAEALFHRSTRRKGARSATG